MAISPKVSPRAGTPPRQGGDASYLILEQDNCHKTRFIEGKQAVLRLRQEGKTQGAAVFKPPNEITESVGKLFSLVRPWTLALEIASAR